MPINVINRMKKLLYSILIFLLSLSSAFSEKNFSLLPLGVYGGEKSGNVSGFLLKSLEDENFPILLDGGTFVDGVEVYLAKTGSNKPVKDFVKNLRAQFISHAHIDHVAGWILRSTIDLNLFFDSGKEWQLPVFINAEALAELKAGIFNGKLWFNPDKLADKPLYKWNTESGSSLKEISAVYPGLKYGVLAMNHSIPTNGFVFTNKSSAFIYFGDTTRLEKSFWENLSATLKKENIEVLSIAIECAFDNEREKLAISSKHLTPVMLMEQLDLFYNYLKIPFKVFIYHIKPDYRQNIELQLKEYSSNKKYLELSILEQGIKVDF